MNLLFFTQIFYLYVFGGGEYVFSLSKQLVRRGHIVHVVTQKITGYATFEVVDGIRICSIGRSFDTDYWANKIIELFRDKTKREEMGRNVFREFVTKYEIRTAVLKIEMLYHAIEKKSKRNNKNKCSMQYYITILDSLTYSP